MRKKYTIARMGRKYTQNCEFCTGSCLKFSAGTEREGLWLLARLILNFVAKATERKIAEA